MILKIWLKNINSFIVLLIFLIFDISGEIFLALLFGQIINSAGSNLGNLNELLIKTVVLIILTVIFFWLYRVQLKIFIFKISKSIREEIFSSIQKENLTVFFSEDTGNKISLLTNDMTILENDYLSSIISVIRAFLLFLFSIITLFLQSYQMGTFLLFSGILSLLLPKFLGYDLSKYKKEFSDMQSVYTSRVTEYLNGFETIKSFDISSVIKKKFMQAVDNIIRKGIIHEKYYSFIQGISILSGSLTFMGGFLFGGYLVSKKVISLGTMITCVQLTNHITNPIYTMVEKIIKIISPVQNDSKNLIRYNNLQKEIIFKNVNFNYFQNNRILSDLNIKIEKNKKYLVIGKSGSGKTTFLKLLSKKITADSGNIYIDNYEINDLDEFSLLNLISCINQNVFLFKGSILENITLYKKYDLNTVKEILKKMGLENFIEKLAVKDFINENGNNLSGGEKQRISIARTLIRNSDIILADEIFSNLDNEIAEKIEKELLTVNNITLVAVAHRLFENNLKYYDEIIALDKGKIAEKGHFNNLIRKNSIFSTLHKTMEK